MNLDYVTSMCFEHSQQDYSWRDSALYALALGIGSDPLDEDELSYVYEQGVQHAVPSQCVTLGWQPFWQDDPKTGIDWVKILHGEIGFTLHHPLPVQATVRAEHTLQAVEDKGAQRGAILHFKHQLTEVTTGTSLATLRSLQFLRADGGCGNYGTPPEICAPISSQAVFTGHIDFSTLPQSALLYRLASRDWMPIHAEPRVAREAGFDRPISHGLNTMGLACRAILKRFLPNQSHRLKSLSVRFIQPAFPGDTIRIELFEQDDHIRFRARALERDVLVLDRGVAKLT